MDKFYVFDYEPKEIWGDDAADAVRRQKIFTKPVKLRRVASSVYDGTPETDRYAFEKFGGAELRIMRWVQVEENPNSSRGNKKYVTVVVELENEQVLGIDAYTQSTAAGASLGSITSEATADAARENGKKGGRPRKETATE